MASAPTAPYFEDLADAPAGGQAHWLTAADGVRLRAVTWGHCAPKGTVLLFPGRTEYAEKYGRAATDLHRRGYATLTVDWRGQGLADRLIPNRALGHVEDFRDYQLDVAALMAHAADQNLAKPYYLLAHSMGGCIGLRSLHDGLDVAACAFTGPMWGIGMAAALRPAAWIISNLAKTIGQSQRVAPGQSEQTYVLRHPFTGNALTTDPEMFAWMHRQMTAQPNMALGGPSLNWLLAALKECRTLAQMPSPKTPCLTFLGTNEDIVDTNAIHTRMAKWPNGTLKMVQNAQHEILMENPDIRTRTFDALATFFTY